MTSWTEQAIDEWAVDRMAERMKKKLAKKRADGRHGWYKDGPDCYDEALIEMFEDHIERRDWVDIANIAMFMALRDFPPMT